MPCLTCGGKLKKVVQLPAGPSQWEHLKPPEYPHKPCPDGFNPKNWGSK